jgi:hypothetical protein
LRGGVGVGVGGGGGGGGRGADGSWGGGEQSKKFYKTAKKHNQCCVVM